MQLARAVVWRQLCAQNAAMQAAISSMNGWVGCRMTDDSALERARGRAARPFLEAADPWLTEARVVAAHGALHKAQVCSLLYLIEMSIKACLHSPCGEGHSYMLSKVKMGLC